jgi:hypothetical protein
MQHILTACYHGAMWVGRRLGGTTAWAAGPERNPELDLDAPKFEVLGRFLRVRVAQRLRNSAECGLTGSAQDSAWNCLPDTAASRDR